MAGPMHIDVDTGVDDAIALALAVSSGQHVVGVSTLSGNVPIQNVVPNTLNVLHRIGATDVPVYRGATKPLVAEYVDATHVHGGNGLGGAELEPSPAKENAAPGPVSIYRNALEFAGELTLVTLGPLTNLAIVLNVRPEITEMIKHVVVMGGACFVPGNVTAHAEFNIYVDPHAANQVLSAPWEKLTLVGLDVTHQTTLARESWDGIDPEDAGSAGLVREIVARTFLDREMAGFYLHDPLAMAVGIDSSFVSTETMQVRVVEEGEERGKTIATPSASGVEVATSVDAERFVGYLCDTLGLPNVGASVGLDGSE